MIAKAALRLSVIICATSFVLSACENEENFPRKYVFDSFDDGDMEAYTNTGEIAGEATVKFIERFSDDLPNINLDTYFWKSGYQSNNWPLELEILSDTKVKITYPDTSVVFDLIRQNGIVYFQSTKAALTFESLTNERLKYSPLTINSLPVGGPAPAFTYLPCYYIIESNGELHLPVVSYAERTYAVTGQYLSSQGVGNYNNVFESNYLDQIQTSGSHIDTIVFQNNTVIFKEK